jgi:hypothetical protein
MMTEDSILLDAARQTVRWQAEEMQRLTAEVRRLQHELEQAQAEAIRLRAEQARYGDLPFEAAFLFHGEPEQLIFRGPAGQVVLRRVRDREA